MTKYSHNILELSGILKVRITFYLDNEFSHLGISLKNETTGETIVELKKLKLMEFLDETTTLFDICHTIEEMLTNQSDQLLKDPETG